MLQRGRRGEEPFRGNAGRTEDIRHGRCAPGDGAGLVEDHGLHGMGRFQRFRRFDENAVGGAAPGAHHDGGGSGKAQRARAGHHQHRDRDGECKFHRGAEIKPRRGGDDRHCDDGRHKDRRRPVCQLGNGRLGAGCLVHQTDDLRQGSIAAHLLRLHPEKAAFADSRTDDRVAGLLGDGDAFAGDGGFIHRGCSFRHHAVGGDRLARPDNENVSDAELLGRNGDLLTAAEHRGRFRGQIHECLNGVCRASLGAGLHEFAKGDERQDGAGAFKIELMGKGGRRGGITGPEGYGHAVHGVDAVQHGSARAERDQRIHIRRTAEQRPESLSEIMTVDDQNGKQQKKLGERTDHGMAVAENDVRQRPAQHPPHGQIKERHRKQKGPEHPPLHDEAGFLCGVCLPGRGSAERSAVSGLFHGAYDGVAGKRRFIVVHRHAVFQQIDGDRPGTGERSHAFFHPCGAGGAGHARDGIGFLHSILLLVSAVIPPRGIRV